MVQADFDLRSRAMLSPPNCPFASGAHSTGHLHQPVPIHLHADAALHSCMSNYAQCVCQPNHRAVRSPDNAETSQRVTTSQHAVSPWAGLVQVQSSTRRRHFTAAFPADSAALLGTQTSPCSSSLHFMLLRLSRIRDQLHPLSASHQSQRRLGSHLCRCMLHAAH